MDRGLVRACQRQWGSDAAKDMTNGNTRLTTGRIRTYETQTYALKITLELEVGLSAGYNFTELREIIGVQLRGEF
jgi:hypothetical protein